jgi:hypothetical protein
VPGPQWAKAELTPRDREVDREVATLYAARVRADATEANRRGDFPAARRVLERTADRILTYAGHDRALRDLASSVRAEIPRFAEEAMSPMALKASFFIAESAAKYRDADGRARRRAP